MVLGIIGAIILLTVSNDRVYANIQFYFNQSEYAPSVRTLVIIPLLTANAYEPNGFYAYYSKNCDQRCLTVYLHDVDLKEQSSAQTVRVLSKLGYEFTNDYHLDLFLRDNPDYLSQYDKVVVLHSEYVTESIYDALQKHAKVIYLAPNAIYGKVEINGRYMRLISGHGYHGNNGFGWKYENTIQEYDKECKNWKLVPISNGYQLNCNPEYTIFKNFELLKRLARF